MFRRLLRSTLVGSAAIIAASVPSTASAQSYYFTSCGTPGVCGYVEAFFTGTLLTVRLSNLDNSLGSALYSAQLLFASALNPATPGGAYSAATTAATGGSVTSIGTTDPGGWFFTGVGGSSVLDLRGFFNRFIEGDAASPFRAAPGDPDNGTWVTTNGYVQFTGDVGNVAGASPDRLTGFGFCTDQDCASGNAALVTPEPATLTLVATGLLGIVAIRRRRKTV